MEDDMEDLSKNLNKYFQPEGAPVSERRYVSGLLFEGMYEVQNRKVNATQVNIKDFIRLSPNALAQGTLNSGESLDLLTTLTPAPPNQNDINFGIPYIAVYQGTIVSSPDADDQIFPQTGDNVVAEDWIVSGAFDWHAYDGTISAWSATVKNISAGLQPVWAVTQWKWCLYNSTDQEL